MPEQRPSARARQAVIRRAKGYCEYCQSPMRYSPDPFAVEHIVPAWQEAAMTPAIWRSPVKAATTSNLWYRGLGPGHRRHGPAFSSSPAALEPPLSLEPGHHGRRGTNAIPRPCYQRERLRLNREGVVNLRRVLATIGQHPPQVETPDDRVLEIAPETFTILHRIWLHTYTPLVDTDTVAGITGIDV